MKVVQPGSEHASKSSRMRLEMMLVLKYTQQFKDKVAAFEIY